MACIGKTLLTGTASILAFLLFTDSLMPAMNNILRDHFGAIALNIRHDYPLVGVWKHGLAIILLPKPVLAFCSLETDGRDWQQRS